MRLPALPLLLTTGLAAVVQLQERQTLAGSNICSEIASNIAGTVYYALTEEFIDGVYHYMTSSEQTPECVVEVANAQDVSTILKLVGSTRTPFAIKSGGHASNPGFSSTTGVQISVAKITEITLSADKSTVEVGLGNVWTDVYTALQGTGVNVVGGRVEGPGTGGFTLGGGYSWKTDQFGLTCDTIQSYNLVLPNGTITSVDSSTPDLFFALKGGLNRFGIVTSIVMETHAQVDMVYGGLQVFDTGSIEDLIIATQTFQTENTDPKAQVILTINGGTIPGAILLSFYDGPERPAAFDPYNNITAIIDTLEGGNRGAFATLSTTGLTKAYMDAVYNESSFYGALAIVHEGLLLSYDVEPFGDYGQYATDSAYPHNLSQLPLNLYFSWKLAAEDSYWRGIMQQSINHLTQVAMDEGIYSADLYAYPNYALDTYTGAQLYGPTNAARLRTIQAQYDPNGVMELAGGFTF
ncbi:Bifunctional solanapyrone synthase [Lachnellula suecica]|uniref:Bifunctional solanapyrone synthase n=1 Tax=Lachnellula suecica TaxID=602035 RepID=A0A8T9C6N5_9HELO|nr:Bifunctional solanapyrone synthase [Lachnellula suecica]